MNRDPKNETSAAIGIDSLVQRLADDGYHTVAFTEDAYVGSSFGFARGFDRFDDGSPASELAAGLAGDAPGTFGKAAAWLERQRSTRFLLFVHTYEVHSPYVSRGDTARRPANRLTPADGRTFPAKRSLLGIALHNEGKKAMDAATIERLRALTT